MSENRASDESIVQGLQEDGYDVWLERRPLPTTLHPNVTVRRTGRRRSPRCSYCRCEGHNILSCNPPEKTRINTIVCQWCDVDEGPFANSSVQEIKNIIDTSLDFYHHSGSNQSRILMLYFVVLNIRDASSVNYLSFTNTLKKIKDAVLNQRIHKIFQSGIQERIDQLQEQLQIERYNQINIRREQHLRRIYTLHNRITEFNFSIATYQYVSTPNTNISSVDMSRLSEIENILYYLNFNYNSEISTFQREYNENPLDLLIQLPDTLVNRPNLTIKINKQILKEEELEIWKNVDCPVCYENIEADNVCMTNCSHKFCYHCISQSLKTDKHRKCPCCRTKVVELVNKSAVVLNDEIKDIDIHFL